MLRFDLSGLYQSVDRARRARGLSWAALARQISGAASTIRRFEHAADAEADGVLALVCWLRVAPEQFVVDTRVAGELLQPTQGNMLRVDMSLLHAASPERSLATGSRTTIQYLVRAAQKAGRTRGFVYTLE